MEMDSICTVLDYLYCTRLCIGWLKNKKIQRLLYKKKKVNSVRWITTCPVRAVRDNLM